MLGADTNNGQNQVAWTNGSSTWVSKHDANWKSVSGSYFTEGSDSYKQLETAFGQDLNKDNII